MLTVNAKLYIVLDLYALKIDLHIFNVLNGNEPGDLKLLFVMQHAQPGSFRHLTFATNPLFRNFSGK